MPIHPISRASMSSPAGASRKPARNLAVSFGLRARHEDTSFHSIQFGQVTIQHDLLAADQIDPAGDAFNGN